MNGSPIYLSFSDWIEPNISQFVCIDFIASGLLTIFFGLPSIYVQPLTFSFLIGISRQVKNLPQQEVVWSSVPKEHLPIVFTTLEQLEPEPSVFPLS
ncbi:hypothetical protein [Sporosarcina ureae]|uniref:hypothetical protein n=1 Tax=Sporosarcina ureae TaxID=1571 RepID=UPI0009DC62A7|nr:hypothetical protein [Sporosarcina ureae]ARF16109.1 hypothetical protein SporoP17a_01580 [Sporosarcina ureae]